MAIEEKVIEQTQEATTPVVTSPTPPVNDLSEQLKQANERAAKAEALAQEKTNDFDSMTKKQLEDFGRTIGIELDKRHTKKVLIKELKEKLNQSS